ncbi:MAG: tRNA 5-methoxyuridine(34)/uridine 5-oxyacetic acid(34) synthase CmoB [Melioribacteraceae bacterium]|nr:MAG: tRNA 5-methoxyuridine(34)/uridine 5-oxyacetic acid(34) synthase CmoB [Melioribacteraceae bacterium]
MIQLEKLYNFLIDNSLEEWAASIPAQVEAAKNHGDYLKWKNIYDNIPVAEPSQFNLNTNAVEIGKAKDFKPEIHILLKERLYDLHPWRKGPFNLFDIFIDTEWRSDWKWERLKNSIQPLKKRNVLDIGCGNGYHCWRMRGAGAEIVIGIDPFLLSVVQFYSIKKFLPDEHVWHLPVGIEQVPANLNFFDTVFSMGILYHRRSPFDHLYEMRSMLRSGGELVLETLVIDGKINEVLVPPDRYAKMRNVWFIPSTLTLESWLVKTGYKNIRLIDVTKTTTEEQRKTEWMTFESLKNFLNPQNPDETIEGHPSPKRAVFIAETP